jgi:hypothetical protein
VLDGVYRTSFTRHELVTSPLLYDAGEINDQNWGDFTLTFDRGRVTYTQRNDLDHYSASGTYTLDGNAITLRFTDGGIFAASWSLYRDVLTLKRTQAELPTPFVLKPWRRAG